MKLLQLLLLLPVGAAVLSAVPRPLPANGYLVFEAETAALPPPGSAPFLLKSDPLARGGSYVVVAPAGRGSGAESALPTGVDYVLPSATEGKAAVQPAAGPQLRVEFSVREPSTVFIWVRARMPRGSPEYLAFQLDGGEFKTWWDHTVYAPLARDRWLWHYARTYDVAPGTHTITAARPMPGMGLDAIAVSTNAAFSPKLAREGCIYLETAAVTPDRRDTFEFDVMGDAPITLWAKARETPPVGLRALLDGQPLAASNATPVAQGGTKWFPLGKTATTSGAHRLVLPASSGVETIAACSKATFTPLSDPYYTGSLDVTEIAIKPDREFKKNRSYRVSSVPGFVPPTQPIPRNVYGGRTDKHGRKTGFFHTEKIDGRWTFVDPEGCVWFNLSVNHFGPDRVLRPRMLAKYGDETKWANEAADFLRTHGFTSVGYHEGAQTPTYELKLKQPMPYFVNGGFMLFFARSKGFDAGAGNRGYPGGCIMPFHPDYAKFCEQHAKKLAAKIASDPFLIGYYLDNEIAIPDDALKKLLALPAADAGHQAAAKWLAQRGLPADAKRAYDEQTLGDFYTYMMDVYLGTTIAALRKVDPNHLICGIRANGQTQFHERFFRVLGRHTDVVSFNLYMAWTPDPTLLTRWLEWSGKPAIISEWYAKGMDTRFDNVKNAGWIVKTQRDRGSFYENFGLTLMQHPAIAGFNWFRLYDDNANNVNKGLLDDDFVPYADLVASVRALNVNAYELLDHLARQPLDTSFAAKVY